MTGSVDEKIPQIYFNNPLDYDVVLDVLHATIDSEYDASGTTGTGFGMIDLSDVFFSGLTSGDTLSYNGSEWVNVPILDFAGTSGTDGTSGTSGTNGTSGTDGTSGTSGTDGTSGTNGTSGTDGTSGTNGTSGSSGTSGVSYTNPANVIRAEFSAVTIDGNSFFFNPAHAGIATGTTYAQAIIVTASGLTTIRIYMGQFGNATNSTGLQIYRVANGVPFSSAVPFSTFVVRAIASNTMSAYTFPSVVINQYDSLFIYCDPTSANSTFYGVMIIE